MQTVFTLFPCTDMYKTVFNTFYISNTSATVVSVSLLIKLYTLCAGFQLHKLLVL